MTRALAVFPEEAVIVGPAVKDACVTPSAVNTPELTGTKPAGAPAVSRCIAAQSPLPQAVR